MKLDWKQQFSSPRWDTNVHLNESIFVAAVIFPVMLSAADWWGEVRICSLDVDDGIRIMLFQESTIEETKQSCEQFIEDFVKQITLGGLKILATNNQQ